MTTIVDGAMRLERSRSAAIDLEEILAYGIAQFGETIGAEYYFSFDAVFSMLQEHPHAGGVARDAGSEVRKVTHRQHRIYYEVKGEAVRVLRILHQRMDVSAAFDA